LSLVYPQAFHWLCGSRRGSWACDVLPPGIMSVIVYGSTPPPHAVHSLSTLRCVCESTVLNFRRAVRVLKHSSLQSTEPAASRRYGIINKALHPEGAGLNTAGAAKARRTAGTARSIGSRAPDPATEILRS